MPDLDLARPTDGDVRALHVILEDPRVWTHYPSLRHADVEQTQALVHRWIAAWNRDGLGPWIVRENGAVIGYGGCDLRGGPSGRAFWNLGYRLAAEVHGRGIATAVARRGIDAVRERDQGTPIVAYLVEHNVASARVAAKVGLTQVHRGPDAGNPDPVAVRLVYSDRPLTAAQLAAALG